MAKDQARLIDIVILLVETTLPYQKINDTL